ncbi:opsin-3-like [Stylophora pistillata]|uniref:opsin-3-like n=1 Tax=Stylophora pistillata TaxID=50429 RepID=UPI000C054116|nr:opsin-3-like [Stylophora pistillata]
MNTTTLLQFKEEKACFKVDIFPLFVFAFLVNVLALISVFKAKPRISTPTSAKQIHLLICCLAVADTVSLGLQCVMPVASFLNCGWWGGRITCGLFGYNNAILILWSAWIVSLLSFQRFFVTAFPFQHQRSFTTKKIKTAVIFIFFMLCCFFTPPFFGVGEFVYYDTGQFCSLSLTPTGKSDTIFLGILVTQGVICVSAVLLFNVHVVESLKSRRTPFHGSTRRAMEDSTATFVSLTKAVAFVFCLCNIPFLIRIAVDLCKQTSHEDLGLEHTLTMALMFLNTLANPFVYVACRRRYRQSLLRLLCFGQRKDLTRVSVYF